MPRSDFAQEAADLLSVANTSQARALNQLVALATRQVTACSGATAGLWHGTEPVVRAASHPDLPALMSVQLSSGRGPVLDALAGGGPVSCPDTLAESRWPEYAEAGVRCGVRCSVTLAHLSGTDAVTLSLFGARPHTLESGQLTGPPPASASRTGPRPLLSCTLISSGRSGWLAARTAGSVPCHSPAVAPEHAVTCRVARATS